MSYRTAPHRNPPERSTCSHIRTTPTSIKKSRDLAWVAWASWWSLTVHLYSVCALWSLCYPPGYGPPEVRAQPPTCCIDCGHMVTSLRPSAPLVRSCRWLYKSLLHLTVMERGQVSHTGADAELLVKHWLSCDSYAVTPEAPDPPQS